MKINSKNSSNEIDRKLKIKIFIVFFISLSGALVFLNRWVITDIGVFSFGRVWQYYVNYFDYGFSRRALLGTILDTTGVNNLIENTYYFAYIFYAANIVILSTLVLLYFLKNRVFNNIYAYMLVFLSPAFILQSGYLTGTQDIHLLIILTIIFLYVRRWFVFLILSAIGLFIHELYIFMLPAAIISLYIKRNNGFEVKIKEIFIGITVFAILIFLLVFIVFSGADIQQEQFELTMSGKLGEASYNHPLWSGYYEIFSSVESNTKGSMSLYLNFLDSLKYWFIPVFYAVSFALINSVYSKVEIWKKIIIFLSLILPMLAFIVATDIYRWVGMSVNISILYLISYSNQNRCAIPEKLIILLLTFSVLAPFGAAGISRPFPAHQLILEKYLSTKVVPSENNSAQK